MRQPRIKTISCPYCSNTVPLEHARINPNFLHAKGGYRHKRYEKFPVRGCNECGQPIPLHPLLPPFVSAIDMGASIERMSADGRYRYTWQQFQGQTMREVRKKIAKDLSFTVSRDDNSLSIFLLLGLSLAFGLAVGALTQNVLWGLGATIVGGSFLAFLNAIYAGFVKTERIRRTKFTQQEIAEMTEQATRWVGKVGSEYSGAYALKGLVDGRLLDDSEKPQEDIRLFAPEKILIPASREVVDMLVLNGFHFDHKTLVVSEDGYPAYAKEAADQALANVSGLPVYLLHDSDAHGLNMRERLLGSEEWPLKAEQVVDLGLRPEDGPNLDAPPFQSEDGTPYYAADSISPKRLMNVLAAAMEKGLPYMSEELAEAFQEDGELNPTAAAVAGALMFDDFG